MNFNKFAIFWNSNTYNWMAFLEYPAVEHFGEIEVIVSLRL